MSLVGRALRTVGERERVVTAPLRWLRVKLFTAWVRVVAAWSLADLDISVAPDVRIGRRIQVRFRPHSRNRLHIGQGTLIDDDVRILLLGGDIHLGDDTEIRRGCLLDVSGTLHLEGGNVLSWGTVVHCAESVHLEHFATAGEFTTLADSSHFFTAADEHHRHNVKTAPIRIGGNTWLGAKATVGRGTTIGAGAVVGANSVVVDDVPDGHLVSGVPARVIRELTEDHAAGLESVTRPGADEDPTLSEKAET